MKTTTAAAALLLAGSAMAAPFTHRRRAAYEERLARRNATEARMGKSNPPLAVDFTSMSDTVKVEPISNVQYSSNWGGAVQIDNGITEVSATANFPSVSVPGNAGSDTYGGSAWVGIDGDTCSSSILQTGFDWTIDEYGDATYAAWYEWLPEYSYNFDITVNPGDQISMKVVADSTTGGTAYITNESTGASVKHSFSGETALCEQNAEWIVEDFEENGSLIPFAQFSKVTFTGSTYVAGGSTKGVSGASILDIKQGSTVMTNCGTSGSETVSCSYTGP